MKKGFTLIELLAVIIILSISFLFIIPKLSTMIKDGENKNIELIESKIIDVTKEYIYDNNSSYTLLLVTEEDKIIITKEELLEYKLIEEKEIKDLDNFYGVKIELNGDELEYTVLYEEEDVSYRLSSYIQFLYKNDASTNSLEKDTSVDANIRYTGSSPNNYVTFNNETWRIIGLFEVETSTGSTEKLMKIVRNDSLGSMSWDSSANGVNNGWGINEWSQADLQSMLNGYYVGNSSTCTYCNGSSQASCSNDCSSTVTPINSTYKTMIQSVKWNTGAITRSSGRVIPADTAYSEERSTTTGKICTSGTYCNDTVTRETSWTGLVGLIYPSDYGYASTDTSCRANIYDTSNVPCKNNNWLHKSSYYWTLSPFARSSNAHGVWVVFSVGYVSYGYASNAFGVRPAIYLKSNVRVTNGDGSSSNPYELSVQ